jgi:shikimate dehydrogenase
MYNKIEIEKWILRGEIVMQGIKIFGIFAHPVHHSMSPLMHNAAYNKLELPYHYQPFDVLPDQLEDAVKSMKVLGISGVNVSIPHKERVIPLLDEVDDEAKLIGAVNTIVLQEDGRLKGYNTDGAGFVESLLIETDVDLSQSNALVLGAGGGAKGIAVYLLKNGCARITIANRTPEKADHLVEQLNIYKTKTNVQGEICRLNWDEVSTDVSSFNLIVNTTPLGMWPNTEQTPIELKNLTAGTIVSDIVYNPLLTRFLEEAKDKGATIHQGVGMFIYQGVLAFKYFTGSQAPVEHMKEVVLKKLQQGG